MHRNYVRATIAIIDAIIDAIGLAVIGAMMVEVGKPMIVSEDFSQ